MGGLIYLIGLIVVILFILSFLGLRRRGNTAVQTIQAFRDGTDRSS